MHILLYNNFTCQHKSQFIFYFCIKLYRYQWKRELTYMTTMGKHIKILRADSKWTQDHLAEKLKVSKQAVSSWERDVASPSIKQLIQLADMFNVSTDFILAKTNYPFRYHFSKNTGEELQNSNDLSFFKNESIDLEKLLHSDINIKISDYTLQPKDYKMIIDISKRVFYRMREREEFKE